MPGPETQFYCSNCGVPGKVDDRFCVVCGQTLESQAIESGGQALESGRAETPWGAVEASASIFIAFGALVLASVAAARIAALFDSQGEALAIWITIHLTALGIVAIVWLLGVRRSQSPLAAIGLEWPTRFSRAAFPTAAVLAVNLAVAAVYSVVAERLGPEILVPEAVDPDILFSGPAIVLSLESLVLVTPLSEEIFFRGFVFAGLLPRFGPRWAIAGSALVFCAFHLSVGLIIPIFVTGVLLAWLYWRTGSLWPSVAAHAAQNAFAVAAALFWG